MKVIRDESGRLVDVEGREVPQEVQDFINKAQNFSPEEHQLHDIETAYWKLREVMPCMKHNLSENLSSQQRALNAKIFGALDMALLVLGNHKSKFKRQK
jgi:hypothetical protein